MRARILEAHLLALDEVVAQHGRALEQHPSILQSSKEIKKKLSIVAFLLEFLIFVKKQSVMRFSTIDFFS
jgi:hypothetical protein